MNMTRVVNTRLENFGEGQSVNSCAAKNWLYSVRV